MVSWMLNWRHFSFLVLCLFLLVVLHAWLTNIDLNTLDLSILDHDCSFLALLQTAENLERAGLLSRNASSWLRVFLQGSQAQLQYSFQAYQSRRYWVLHRFCSRFLKYPVEGTSNWQNVSCTDWQLLLQGIQHGSWDDFTAHRLHFGGPVNSITWPICSHASITTWRVLPRPQFTQLQQWYSSEHGRRSWMRCLSRNKTIAKTCRMAVVGNGPLRPGQHRQLNSLQNYDLVLAANGFGGAGFGDRLDILLIRVGFHIKSISNRVLPLFQCMISPRLLILIPDNREVLDHFLEPFLREMQKAGLIFRMLQPEDLPWLLSDANASWDWDDPQAAHVDIVVPKSHSVVDWYFQSGQHIEAASIENSASKFVLSRVLHGNVSDQDRESTSKASTNHYRFDEFVPTAGFWLFAYIAQNFPHAGTIHSFGFGFTTDWERHIPEVERRYVLDMMCGWDHDKIEMRDYGRDNESHFFCNRFSAFAVENRRSHKYQAAPSRAMDRGGIAPIRTNLHPLWDGQQWPHPLEPRPFLETFLVAKFSVFYGTRDFSPPTFPV